MLFFKVMCIILVIASIAVSIYAMAIGITASNERHTYIHYVNERR